jgi:DNA-binding response OmpR family regulator
MKTTDLNLVHPGDFSVIGFRNLKPERTVCVAILTTQDGPSKDGSRELAHLISENLSITHTIDLAAPYQFQWKFHVVHPLEAITSIRSLGVDLCVVMFSHKDAGSSGLQVIRAIRESEHTQDTGLVARLFQPGSGAMSEAIQAGADVCAMSTDSVEVLCLAIRALARRVTGFRAATKLTLEDLSLDLSSGEVIWKEGQRQLGPTPAALLAAFLKQPDRCWTRAELKHEIKNGRAITNRSLDAQVSKLKREIPWLRGRLKSLYGRGYILSAKANFALKNIA